MTENSRPVIHVIDDDISMRTALKRHLCAAGYSVICYESAGEFLVADVADAAGAILLDLELGGPDGLALQKALNRRSCSLPIVFMTAFGDVSKAVAAMKAGAADFLEKPFEGRALLSALASALRSHAAPTPLPADDDICLDERERRVLQRVVTGWRTKQIAAELGLSERTIKSCRADVMKKLRAASFPELVLKAEHLRLL